MELEKKLSQYIVETRFDDLPQEAIDIVKNVVLTVLGTTIAGATAEGCEALISQAREWGGKEEATILIHGSKVPAYNAALVNSAMARALDFCDAMSPGLHLGSSSVPTALATAELAGGCSGKEFLTALVLGNELASRLNLSESAYDGFDPTGVCGIFAATAIASKILHLNRQQALDALALTFNKSAGSLQSNVDGSLAVRLIQGFVSQNGIICAQLAQRGISGPQNFLEGVYGYFHIFAKDKHDPQATVADLGKRFELTKTVFKKYPSCGGTLSSTDAILDLIKEKDIVPEDLSRIDIKVTPYIYKLVGHQFRMGENPKVNAQFNIQYCVANALLRKSSKLEHFDEPSIREPKIMELIDKIHVMAEPTLDERGHTAIDMRVTTRDGGVLHKSVDIARGFPGNPLTKDEHNERFQDCVRYAKKPLPPENIEKLVSLIAQLEEIDDVRVLIPLLLSEKVPHQ
jgi:2-methylcitrate dehydratase PrpD